jgi:hypothetical protein
MNFQDIFQIHCFFVILQKLSSGVGIRSLSDVSTDLKKVLTDKIPKEQERIKTFRKNFGNQKVGEVTVDMVRELYVTCMAYGA